MAQIKFGVSQLSNPTPSSHSKPIDIFCAVAGVVIAWITTAAYIPSNISDIVSSILGGLIGVAQSLKPFWGVQSYQHSFPIDEVKEVDTKTK